ncbi:hypothetical protein ACJMK2_007341 [Sinanodonta woodiana]|uniref:C2H2-type domain-containing protein n=1 Tax=Sinanodonta woodiana TaxID=1069815 RepID=A0ABD3VI97_SINWO
MPFNSKMIAMETRTGRKRSRLSSSTQEVPIVQTGIAESLGGPQTSFSKIEVEEEIRTDPIFGGVSAIVKVNDILSTLGKSKNWLMYILLNTGVRVYTSKDDQFSILGSHVAINRVYEILQSYLQSSCISDQEDAFIGKNVHSGDAEKYFSEETETTVCQPTTKAEPQNSEIPINVQQGKKSVQILIKSSDLPSSVRGADEILTNVHTKNQVKGKVKLTATVDTPVLSPVVGSDNSDASKKLISFSSDVSSASLAGQTSNCLVVQKTGLENNFSHQDQMDNTDIPATFSVETPQIVSSWTPVHTVKSSVSVQTESSTHSTALGRGGVVDTASTNSSTYERLEETMTEYSEIDESLNVSNLSGKIRCPLLVDGDASISIEDMDSTSDANKTSEGDLGGYVCKECGKSFKEKRYLATHLKRHLGLRNHECPICKWKFFERTKMKLHMESHKSPENRSLPHRCSICNHTFYNLAACKDHMNTHFGLRPYKCQEPNCAMSFAHKIGLKRHGMVHSRECPFVCGHCSKGFKFKSNLDSHITLHTNTGKHVCKDCGKVYTAASSLRKHTCTQKAGKFEGLNHNTYYLCAACNFLFPTFSDCQKHQCSTADSSESINNEHTDHAQADSKISLLLTGDSALVLEDGTLNFGEHISFSIPDQENTETSSTVLVRSNSSSSVIGRNEEGNSLLVEQDGAMIQLMNTDEEKQAATTLADMSGKSITH